MDESVLFNGVLRSLLGGRRRRSHRALRYLTRGSGSFLTNPTTLLTAAGLAWGIYETLQGSSNASSTTGTGLSPQPASASQPSAASEPLPPLPVTGAATAVSPDTMRLLRLA